MRAPAALLDNARTCALANPIVVAAGAPVIRSFPFVVWYDVSVEAAVCSHARIVERSFLVQRQMEGVLELACTVSAVLRAGIARLRINCFINLFGNHVLFGKLDLNCWVYLKKKRYRK